MLQTLFLFLIVGGLATKQISAIFIHGSVFTWLREGIKTRLKKNKGGFSHWVFQKLDELFSCLLCLTTQVAFWFCVLPATLYYQPDLQPLFLAYAMFIATMAISGLSMILQNLSEFLARAN